MWRGPGPEPEIYFSSAVSANVDQLDSERTLALAGPGTGAGNSFGSSATEISTSAPGALGSRLPNLETATSLAFAELQRSPFQFETFAVMPSSKSARTENRN